MSETELNKKNKRKGHTCSLVSDVECTITRVLIKITHPQIPHFWPGGNDFHVG